MELTIDRLTKQYGSTLAVDGFSISLKPGIYGLLGANGAGKTTLMRLICDVQKSTSGDITYNGVKINDMGEEYRSLLGYLPQDFGYYPEFTAYKFLLYISSLKGLSPSMARLKSLELLDTVGLSEQKNKKIKTFSGGMKQRLGIAQAMLNDPSILILDEPTAGLDPKERVRFRNLISSFSKDKIVILSTHIVSDIEYIADEILVMKKGCLIQKGTPETIIKSVEGYVWECEVDKNTADELNMKFSISNLKNFDNNVVLRIVAAQKPHSNACKVAPNMEDVYLYYFNEGDNCCLSTRGGKANERNAAI